MSFSSGLKVFAEKLADDLMGSFLNTIIYLSLPLLRLFILNFCHYNYKVSWCEPPWADLLGTLGTWTWIFVSFPRLGEFSAIIQISLFFFFLLGPCNVNASILDVTPRDLKLSLFLYYYFSIRFGWFPHLSLPGSWFILLYSLIYCWFPPCVFFFISVIIPQAYFILLCIS